ncbi:MAG TPA: hypothetical protein VK939_14570 [Longimicrobiales bacterium]|nr:hypothetical protein [Longimicrobiales bacterium]
MTEYTLTDMGSGTGTGAERRGLSGVVALRLLGGLLLVGWSAKWLPPMFAMVGAQTAIGQHGLHGLPSGYEVFELLFVAGHCAVRWLPGVALALGLFWLSGWLRRRALPR